MSAWVSSFSRQKNTSSYTAVFRNVECGNAQGNTRFVWHIKKNERLSIAFHSQQTTHTAPQVEEKQGYEEATTNVQSTPTLFAFTDTEMRQSADQDHANANRSLHVPDLPSGFEVVFVGLTATNAGLSR